MFMHKNYRLINVLIKNKEILCVSDTFLTQSNHRELFLTSSYSTFAHPNPLPRFQLHALIGGLVDMTATTNGTKKRQLNSKTSFPQRFA
jgi:hypothetical protein